MKDKYQSALVMILLGAKVSFGGEAEVQKQLFEWNAVVF